MKWLAIVLTAIFTTAKLMNIINWSWWLVLLPAWIYMGFILLILIIAFVVAVMEDVQVQTMQATRMSRNGSVP